MLDLDALTNRRRLVEESPDLSALRDHLVARAAPLLEKLPPVPRVKALLSRDGGICPDDRTALEFDPWSPDAHRCPACGRSFGGERHHAHWARAQHLWLAERAAHLAVVHAMTGDPAAAARSRELLAAYRTLYFELPNRDNVLGPSHLFFSTYLESIWILDYLAAASILRELGELPDDEIEGVNAIADEAATLIASFNEGLSNRQTWNSAALTAIAVWFGDEELAVTAVEGRTGLLGHLADGFGADGLWLEGENYHLFAMRGLLVGLQWAATAGAQLLESDEVAAHLGSALMAPANSALPDLTFPARKDSRYGVSLAHPAYLESWEAGPALLDERAPAALAPWLHALYAVAPRPEALYDAYLHDAGEPLPARRSRTGLSWWALLTMPPALPEPATTWSGETRLLQQQGLAVLRSGRNYVGLECGGGGGGHGHPDRLHLTVHAGGVHWLPDPGAGSYVSPDLFWYRSTLAHNAPVLDERNQPIADSARCAAFAASDGWSWCAATWRDVHRRVVLGPRWALDVVQFDGRAPARLDLPWHVQGVVTPPGGSWTPDAIGSEFVSNAERLVRAPGTERDAIVLRSSDGEGTIALWFAGDGELLRADAPGLPGEAARRPFYLRRADGNQAVFFTAIDLTGSVTGVDVQGATVVVREGELTTTLQFGANDVAISGADGRVVLAGAMPPPLGRATFVLDRPVPVRGPAIWAGHPPALDGSLAGFDCDAALALDSEDHYLRSEEEYPGPDALSATVCVNWSDNELFVAVDVTKDDVVIRPDDAPPLNLDNEPEDINADGVQVYCRMPDAPMHGWLVNLREDGSLAVRPVGATPSATSPSGRWQRTDHGYCVTIRVPCPLLGTLRRTDRVGFDVIVNEMRRERVRRAGQLVWSGGGGWVYLRGDRQDPAQLGELELTG